MIRNPWMLVWICLFVMQVISLLVHRHWSGPLDMPPHNIDYRLVELAERTNSLMHLKTNVDPVREKTVSRSEILVQRESLILKLHRLQLELQEQGVETQIVQDLEAYLGIPEASNRLTEMNAFITGILDWIEPFAVATDCCSLERLSLFPDGGASLPVLAFELAGTPAQMAESLLTSTSRDSSWDLVELDMLIPENEHACWLRGSFAFMKPLPVQ